MNKKGCSGHQWAPLNKLKDFFLGKASWLTDNEVTRVISFKNIILQLAVSRHVVGGSLFLDFHPVGHWLQDAPWIVMSFGAQRLQPTTFLLFLTAGYFLYLYLWLDRNPKTTAPHYTFSTMPFLYSIYVPSHQTSLGASTKHPLLRSSYSWG